MDIKPDKIAFGEMQRRARRVFRLDTRFPERERERESKRDFEIFFFLSFLESLPFYFRAMIYGTEEDEPVWQTFEG